MILGAFLITVVSSMCAQRIHADDPRSPPFVFDAPAACPQAADFEAHLRRFLDRPEGDLFGAMRVVLVLLADGELGPFSMRLTITMADGSVVERAVSHRARCALLVETAAFVVAMAIDPEAASQHAARSSETPEAAPDPVPEVPESAPDEPEDVSAPPVEPAPEAHVVRYGVGVDLGVSLGVVPRASFDATVRGVVTRRALRAELGIHARGPHAQTIDQVPGAEARYASIAATANGCFVAGDGALRAPLCGGLDVGIVTGHAQGDALDDASRARRLSVVAALRPGAQYALTDHVALLARAELGVALVAPAFGVRGVDAHVYEASRFVFGATLGAEASWR